MFHRATWENSKENLASYGEKKIHTNNENMTFCGLLNYHY